LICFEIKVLTFDIKVMKRVTQSTIVTLDLSAELTEAELDSFREQARANGHSLKDHLTMLVFGRAAPKDSRQQTSKEGAA
jgi:hypothetical protein